MKQPEYQKQMQEKVDSSQRRKIESRADQRSIWYGLGMFGLVGWSIAVPTVLGIFIGLWLDNKFDHPFSCTLMGLFGGLMSGCWIAWYWVQREGLDVDSASSGESKETVDPDEENKQ